MLRPSEELVCMQLDDRSNGNRGQLLPLPNVCDPGVWAYGDLHSEPQRDEGISVDSLFQTPL